MLIGDFGGILQLILIIFKIGFTFDSFIVLFFYRVLLYCRDRQKKYNGPYLYLVSFRSSVFMIFIILLILFLVLVGFSISMF